MKLPNGENAEIDPRKLTDYSLNHEHDDGKHKALLFQDVLGLGIENGDVLLEALRAAARDGEAVLGRSDRYGQRYMIDFMMAGPHRTARIRSAWIIAPNSITPRLVTCYII